MAPPARAPNARTAITMVNGPVPAAVGSGVVVGVGVCESRAFSVRTALVSASAVAASMVAVDGVTEPVGRGDARLVAALVRLVADGAAVLVTV